PRRRCSLVLLRPPPRCHRFPYTTLFRSAGVERRLRATVEWAGVGLGTADLQGRFLQVTDRLAAILGCGREELLQTTLDRGEPVGDRKSTRLNSSHVSISYAVFCLKKKKH